MQGQLVFMYMPIDWYCPYMSNNLGLACLDPASPHKNKLEFKLLKSFISQSTFIFCEA